MWYTHVTDSADTEEKQNDVICKREKKLMIEWTECYTDDDSDSNEKEIIYVDHRWPYDALIHIKSAYHKVHKQMRLALVLWTNEDCASYTKVEHVAPQDVDLYHVLKEQKKVWLQTLRSGSEVKYKHNGRVYNANVIAVFQKDENPDEDWLRLEIQRRNKTQLIEVPRLDCNDLIQKHAKWEPWRSELGIEDQIRLLHNKKWEICEIIEAEYIWLTVRLRGEDLSVRRMSKKIKQYW